MVWGPDYKSGPRVYCLDMGLQDRAGCRAQPVGQDPVRPSFSVILLFSGHPGFLWGVTLALTVTRTAFASPTDHLALSLSDSTSHDGMPACPMTRESQRRTPHGALASVLSIESEVSRVEAATRPVLLATGLDGPAGKALFATGRY